MCKILIIPKVCDSKRLRRFIKAAKNPMTVHDDDGFGYAAMTTAGLAVEKWLNPMDAFKKISDTEIAWRVKATRYLQRGEYGYTKIGDIQLPYTAAIIHARQATCAVTIENAHPFVAFGKLALVHNGIIENPQAFPAVHSTCDSESILKAYIAYDIENHPENIQQMTNKLAGSFACGIMNSEKFYIDILHDNKTSFICEYVEELGTEVFATNIGIIDDACKECKFKIPQKMFHVYDNILIRYSLDGTTLVFNFTPTYSCASPVVQIPNNKWYGHDHTRTDWSE